MAYIRKRDFEIVTSCNDFDGECPEFTELFYDNYFECDDFIALPVSLLNKKGYKTIASCSGHIFKKIEGFYANYIDVKNKNLMYYKKLKEPITDEYNDTYEYLTMEFYDDIDGYITFREQYFENIEIELPCFLDLDITMLEYEGEVIEVNSLRFTYESESGTYDRIKEMVKLSELLYKWVESLPDLTT